MKIIIKTIFLLISSICLCACLPKNNSTFSITYLNVGQGDSALVECDGHYMLIDGGDTFAGKTVYDALQEADVQKLDILAISHLHADHFGGLVKALTYPHKIGITICNEDDFKGDSARTLVFNDFSQRLSNLGSKITIPHNGETFKLGSAKVEVVDVAAEKNNDSLVLLVTYGKTRFLFTGDIEETGQKRIINKYANNNDVPFKINVIKMPHHGKYENTLYTFLRTFMPDYAVISVGSNNQYSHPSPQTIDLLNNREAPIKTFRTNIDGNITVQSDGKEVLIKGSK